MLRGAVEDGASKTLLHAVNNLDRKKSGLPPLPFKEPTSEFWWVNPLPPPSSPGLSEYAGTRVCAGGVAATMPRNTVTVTLHGFQWW